MVIKPAVEEKREGRYLFGSHVKVLANACIDKDIVREIWKNGCFQASELEVDACKGDYVFVIGEGEDAVCSDYAYILNITEKGVVIRANTKEGLMQGFLTLIERIDAVCLEEGEEILCLDCCLIKDKPVVKNRMVHMCVFHETKLDFLRKYIRLCAALKFTHIVIEFWASFPYDCMKELAWSGVPSKDQYKEIFTEARDLGLQIIPMFNHLGHAAGARAWTGKHAILDQNPRLQTLFSRDGWVWKIEDQKVKDLHKKIREELMEICGEGDYFHIGCDEAIVYGHDVAKAPILVKYINEISEEMKQCGRRVIMWADMLLDDRFDQTEPENYFCHCKVPEIGEYYTENLSRDIVMADWQYNRLHGEVETSTYLTKLGFDTLCCPWNIDQNVVTCVRSVQDYSLYGLLHTTWHTVRNPQDIRALALSATKCWQGVDDFIPRDFDIDFDLAQLLRSLYFVKGDYATAGWIEKQIYDKA